MRPLAINLTVPHEPDLSWLLNKSASAAGIKSNFGPLADAAAGGWGSGRHDPHEGRTRAFLDRKTGLWRHPFLDAVERERELYARWSKLTEETRAILGLAYIEQAAPTETHHKLGALVFVATLTAAFRETFAPWESTPMEFLARACAASKQGALVDSMRMQASTLVEVAAKAWRATKPRKGVVEDVDPDTARRYAAASKPVDGPVRVDAPRTWAPMGITPGWVSPRERAMGKTANSWEPVKERKARP